MGAGLSGISTLVCEPLPVANIFNYGICLPIANRLHCVDTSWLTHNATRQTRASGEKRRLTGDGNQLRSMDDMIPQEFKFII